MPVSPDAGPHKFLALQPGSDEPVAYDPCRPIPFVMNERTAPPGARELVEDAIGVIRDVTGLHFVDEGQTRERPSDPRPPFQSERYGDRWAPLLIAWSDPAERTELMGTVAGIGGSTSVASGQDTIVYVTGLVTLDGPQLAEMMRRPGGRAQARAVILHELGHFVGLDHVDDPRLLMHERSPVTQLQPGDLAGLSQLGAGRCISVL